MAADATTRSSGKSGRRLPITFSASAVTQLLAGLACFLGAYVLPLNYPELGDTTRSILLVTGTIACVLGLGNLIFGHYLNRLFVRFGMRSRVVIPREGMVYLSIMLMLAIGALLGHQNTLLLVFGMMAGPFVLNGWIVYFMLKGVTVERSAPRQCMAGEYISVDITVANAKRTLASRILEARDFIGGEVLKGRRQSSSAAVTFLRVPASSSRTGRYRVCFQERGVYQLGPMRISSRFPLGIGERGQVFPSYVQILVRPALGKLHSQWSRRERELVESLQSSDTRAGIFDDEFHCIREYRDDDNPRAIHWRSTARCGELMVREFQQNRQSDLFVVLDLCFARAAENPEREMAISLAATICVEQAKSASGGNYTLVIAGAEQSVLSSHHAGLFREAALDSLAVCKESKNADLHKAIASVVDSGITANCRGVIITPRPDFAQLVIPDVVGDRMSEAATLPSRTTIVEATLPSMQKVFSMEDDLSSARAATDEASADQRMQSYQGASA
jgi:uncharacterized protein (DUF58 family)